VSIETTAVYSNGALQLHQTLPLDDQQVVRVKIDPINLDKGPENLTQAEFEAILDEMAADSPPDTPVLPHDFSRADCYSDDRA
jgi:hypothetical protein